MKKHFLYLVILIFPLSFLPGQLCGNEIDSKNLSDEVKSESSANVIMEVKNLNNRLIEISELEGSELSSSEKKELRKEVRNIKKELKRYSKTDNEAYSEANASDGNRSGIYISTGALIIIILILILI
jgi:hypothetical protein